MAKRRKEKPELSEDEEILNEAKKRFKLAEDWESDFRRLFVIDTKFANGDSDNGWQWPDDLRKDREINKRPALTINKVQRNISLITNDMRQNKPSINIKATNNQASYKSAQIYEGLVRNIEYKSGAASIYNKAGESQVEGGIGYWTVRQMYVDDDSFNQELRICPVDDAMSVYLDCDIKQPNGRDAEWGFLFDDVIEEEFEAEHPDLDMAKVKGSDGISEADNWVKDGYIRVAEYFRLKKTKDELIYVRDKQGNESIFKLSEAPPEVKKMLSNEDHYEEIKRRDIIKKTLQWFKIAGCVIIKKELDLKGQYIPIVRAVGVERVIEGKLERKGLTRWLKDPQRMYNYNSSAQVEYGALQTKSPWIGPKAAFEGNEVAWNNANRSNAAYLTYNHEDEEGNPLPPPQKPDAPGSSPAFIDGMKIAAAEFEMITGQFAPQPNLEKTPTAVNERRRQTDLSPYHFLDNMALAVQYTGEIIIDLVPHVYDTRRVEQILGKDGTQTNVTIDPKQQQALIEQNDEQEEIKEVLFNPAVGKYQVQSDIGPAYATQREAAFHAFIDIVTSSPELINEIGDLMFLAADFPMADKIAERIRRKINSTAPWLLSDEPGPVMQKVNAELQQANQTIAELLQQLAEKNLKLQDYTQKNEIAAEDAKSKRITALSNAQPEIERMGGADQLEQVIRRVLTQMMNDGDLADQDLSPGAVDRVAQETGDQEQGVGLDGGQYIPDPNRPGKFMKAVDNG